MSESQKLIELAASENAMLRKALKKICDQSNDPVAVSIAGEAVEIAEQNDINRLRASAAIA